MIEKYYTVISFFKDETNISLYNKDELDEFLGDLNGKYVNPLYTFIKEFEDFFNIRNKDGYPLYLIIKGTPIYPMERKILIIDEND